MNTAILSNINISSIVEKIQGFTNVYSPAGYNTWTSELLDTNSELHKRKIDIIFFLLDGLSLIEEMGDSGKIQDKLRLIENFAKSHPQTAVVVNTIDIINQIPEAINGIPTARRLQSEWNSCDSKHDFGHLYWLDLAEQITIHGREKMYSRKGWYLGNLRFSNFGEEIIVEEIKRIIESFKGNRKKCLILDLDNTLWGGVVGEVGLDGISLSAVKEGSQFYIFQRQLKRLKEMGVLLTICSKNNPEDAKEVLNNHPAMILKEKDFVLMKINWKSKPENISESAQELNIGLDSMVFIDDSEFERESVKSQLPDVIVPEMPKDTTKLPEWFLDIERKYFLFISVTEEDANKTEMYQSQAKRKQLEQLSTNLEEYLISLSMKQKICVVSEKDIVRAAQLTQKTNQFNLTTRRYTEFDIRRMIESDDYLVLMSSMEDRFGDNGKIALMIVERNGRRARIDSFLMSCRVMGRYVENQFVDYVENMLANMGVEEIEAEYITTKKSAPVKNFWDSLGYKRVKEEDGKVQYCLRISEKPERVFYSELKT